MSREEPEWMKNDYGDTKPVCPYCKKPYCDGDIFNIKNYPDDGVAVIFFPCEDCKKEAKLNIEWVKIKEGKYVAKV